jgi:hypothetical protein
MLARVLTLRMSRRRGGATAAALALATSAKALPAHAQHVEARASLTLTGAYTRSWSDSPTPSALTFAGPSVALSPVLAMLVDTPRTENALGYALSLSLPIVRGPTVNSSSLTYANRVTYLGRYALDELTSMTLGAGLSQSPLDSFVPSQDPTAAPIQTVPAGAANMLAVNVNEGVSRLVTDRTSITQAAAFAYGDPLVPSGIASRTYVAQSALGWTREFLYDTLGMTLTNQYDHFTASPQLAASSVLINTLSLDYAHAFSEALSVTLTPGATATVSPGAARSVVVQPSGTATLRYDHRFASAALAFAHQAEPNLATATVAFDDMVTLRFLVPIATTGLVAAGTAGFTRSTPIESAEGRPKPSAANVFLADTALDYYPASEKRFSIGMRAFVARQAFVSDPTSSFTRYTLALHVTYAYPSAEAAMVRPALTPGLSVRAPTQSEIVSSDRVTLETP